MKFQHKVFLIGGVLGALLGLAAAFLFLKANQDRITALESGEGDEKSVQAPVKITPAEGISVGLTVVNLLRQIVTLGQA